MKEHFDSKEDQASGDLYGRMEFLIRKNPWTWQSIGAVLGLAGGILSPFLGALLTVSTWFIHSQGAISILNILSIVSIVLTIPLLAFGAHCLDLLEAKTAPLSPPIEPPPTEATSASATSQVVQRNGRRRLNRVLTVLVLLLALPAKSYAQQTVFNVPATDVLDPGKVYFELDISAKPNEPRFSSFVPRVVVGSPAATEFQVPRVARERGVGEDAVRQIVAAHTQGRQFGFLGEPTVNVLELNLDLDSKMPMRR